MAYYTYKQVRDLLPQHIIDKQGPDYEGDGNYDGDQWNAAADYINELKEVLAAKDAENNRIRHVLQQLLIDSNGKIRADHWNRAMSALEMNNAPSEPHPDSARLDKLPQCFHMLRTLPGDGLAGWWLSYAPNNVYSDVREAIDAHQEPKP